MNALPEKLQGAAFTDMDGIRNFLQCDLPVIICMNKLHHHLQLRPAAFVACFLLALGFRVQE